MHEFSDTLIDWYGKHSRNLPWRNTKNAYHIWLSEIILQQTRVAQGLPYYLCFINSFPNVQALANAPEDLVLNHWKGLGYYSRARNLHKTAKQVCIELDGEFPNKYSELLKLKGIGTYTAAAIASFAHGEVVPVLDGNVYRVLSRIFNMKQAIDQGSSKKLFFDLAFAVMDKKDPATFNQAIMDFGALQCTPKNPNCNNCPFIFSCEAKSKGTVHLLPFKSKKLSKKNRYFTYFIMEQNKKWAVVQRSEADIWAKLYEFPMVETSNEINNKEELQMKTIKGALFNFDILSKSSYQKHVLTHQNIYFSIWKVKLRDSQNSFLWHDKQTLSNLAFPKLLENYLPKL